MSNFMVNLWESIFTPGPTPTLLIATNATFGALQLVLFSLLLFTHSIHFAILSVLCAGLWYAINWFAREVEAAKAAEARSPKNTTSSDDKSSSKKNSRRQVSPDPTTGVGGGGSDTETETEPPPVPTSTTARLSTSAELSTGTAAARRKPAAPQPGQAPMPPPTVAPAKPTSSSPATTAPASSSTHLQPNAPRTADSQSSGRRRPSLGESSGYVSTDSEWEKVSEGEGK
jgi:cytoskeletal protein RodZ